MKLHGYRKLLAFAASSLTVVLVQVGLPESVADKITDAVIWIAGFYLAGQSTVDVVGRRADAQVAVAASESVASIAVSESKTAVAEAKN